ncbi:MAG TPA: metallopeptidase TldD-related protein [Edaphobacter sp.]|nr:metallopeptidase TldD-related protein [Edaphobacter sp.]
MTRQRAVVAGAGLAGLGLMLAWVALPGRAVWAAEAPKAGQASTALVETMEAELHRAMNSLGSGDNTSQQPKPYFLSYAVADGEQISIAAQFGAITGSNDSHRRFADVQVRIGTPAEDNTHGDHRNSALTTIPLPLIDDRAAIARSLWFATNRGYGKALDGYLKVKTEQEVRAKEEDRSPDFSTEEPKVALLPAAPKLKVDRTAWEARLRELSGLFKQYPNVFFSRVVLEASSETDYFVSSEGAKVATPNHVARLVILGRTRTADGMDMFRAETFEADEAGHLPEQKVLAAKIADMGKSLEALRVAPVTDPYNGPAILSGRAAAVFFHEVLGHRLEGQRQRGDDEGQTFTKLLGKQILPSFMSVADDPTLTKFDGTWLSGHYDYDDEGQQARRVDLIRDGVLETFLMSRLPIAGFAHSNGHGRAEVAHMPTGRQGNLIVTSSKTVSDAQLRQMLIDEAKKQGKAYGLYFEDISSGFAVTTRRSPQAFQVIPLVVYRVYVDGRPDELVRGVSIVGTPQAALARIVATDDKQQVFNGICGAESGSIPVSAVAPAMLVSEIETQKQAQGTARPPILPPPGAADAGGKDGQ